MDEQIRPGDRVTWLDIETVERNGVVMMVGAPFTLGDDDNPSDEFDVAVIDTPEGTRWCYLSQVTEANGVAVEP